MPPPAAAAFLTFSISYIIGERYENQTPFVSVFLLCVCLSVLLAIPAPAADAPDIRAKAALLVDVNTDAVAYAQNIHEQNYPASLTKVMTALLILEKASGNDALLTQEVTAPESAFATPITTLPTEAPPASRPARC